MSVRIETTPLAGLLILTPARHGDDRGFFCETWNRAALAGQGIDVDFVQDNQSLSPTPGTLRGLHFQTAPQAQVKLVRCGRGALWDLAVDLRTGSPTFGRWFGTTLSAANGRQMLVPVGFAHGFVTRALDTEILYKCSAPYAPACEGALRWDDPAIGIDWGLAGPPVIAARDAAAPLLAELDNPFPGPFPKDFAR